MFKELRYKGMKWNILKIIAVLKPTINTKNNVCFHNQNLMLNLSIGINKL